MNAKGARLEIHLFGGINAALCGRELRFESDKTRALLAYLALEGKSPLRRERIAGLLWPDQSDESAGTNLRKTLWRLRKALDAEKSRSEWLSVGRHAVSFDCEAGVTVDVLEFEQLLETIAVHPHRFAETCRTCAALRRRASELYRGDFLAGFSVSDSDLFENWAMLWRENLAIRAAQALEALLRFVLERNERSLITDVINQLLRIDPWNEMAHTQLVRLFLEDGNRISAQHYYAELSKRFESELGMPPPEELRALVERESEAGGADRRESERVVVPGMPTPLDPFVGRAAEVARLQEWIENPEGRLATIVGPGGIGKTRLAIVIVQLEVTGFPDGARFITLSEHDSAWAEKTKRWVDGKSILLVVDGVDGSPSATSTVENLLKHNPGLVVLTTSRVRLGVFGESVFHLGGLEVPPDGEVENGARYDAAELFIQGATRSFPEFAAAPSDYLAIGEICRRVGGMPLALNLASAWVGTLSVARIAEELRMSFDLLRSGDAASAYEIGIKAVLEQSLALLGDEEGFVFARLSVFHGGFDSEAAASVAGATAPVLSGLIRKSFVQHLSADRYDLHPLFQEFGRNLLFKTQNLERANRAHFDYYLSGARDRSERLLKLRSVDVFHWMIVERLNLSAAHAWALQADPEGARALEVEMHEEFHGDGFHNLQLP